MQRRAAVLRRQKASKQKHVDGDAGSNSEDRGNAADESAGPDTPAILAAQEATVAPGSPAPADLASVQAPDGGASSGSGQGGSSAVKKRSDKDPLEQLMEEVRCPPRVSTAMHRRNECFSACSAQS